MAAHADDLRYFYAAHLGRTETVAATDASGKSAALSPGRYLIHFTDLSTAGIKVWIRQGPQADVVATAAAPSFPLSSDGIRAIEITVRSGPVGSDKAAEDAIAVIMPTGETANLHITKISRDKA